MARGYEKGYEGRATNIRKVLREAGHPLTLSDLCQILPYSSSVIRAGLMWLRKHDELKTTGGIGGNMHGRKYELISINSPDE